MPSKPLQSCAAMPASDPLAGPWPARSAVLDLSLGHLRTSAANRPALPGSVRWRVWVMDDGGTWKRSAGAMPEGAAISYATHARYAAAWAFEAELPGS